MISVKNPAPRATGQAKDGDAADQRPSSGPLRTTWTVLAASLTAAGTIGTLITEDRGWVLLGIVGLIGLLALGRRLLQSRSVRVAVRAAREQELAERTTALADCESGIAALEEEIGRLRQQNLALQVDIAASDEQISALRAEVCALRAQNTAGEQALRQARTALERIADRQFPLYEEEVEITVMIGEHGDDVVIERHRTTPKPHLVYRMLRPITATTGRTRPSFDELELTCEVDRDDTGAAVQLVSETAEGSLVLVLFQPGLREVTEWTLRYRAPRLWDPLRQDGMDRLGWAPSTRDGRQPTIPVTSLTVHFVFPLGTRSFAVRECHDLGQSLREIDERRVTWRDPAPEVQWYEWELWWSRGD